RGFIFLPERVFSSFFPKSLIGYDNYRPLDNIFATEFVAAGIDGMDSTGFAITLPGVFFLAGTLNPVNYVIFPLFIAILYFAIFKLSSYIWTSRVKYYFAVNALNLYYSGNMREFAFCIYSLVIYHILIRLPLYSLRKRNRIIINQTVSEQITSNQTT
ncbi:MAG TPA: hypothetical protein VFM18_03260, partial [Methanosarcina sp.]|nr:hypothetical protein [Methanosarcina sp.]